MSKLISNTSDIGLTLHERRSSLGKSVTWLAGTIDVPRSTVKRVESGQTSPSWKLVLAFCQALDLQPVLVPREKMTAVEAVVQMSDEPETPPLAGYEW